MRFRFRVRPHSKGIIELTTSHLLKMRMTSSGGRSLRWSAPSVLPTRSSSTCLSRNSSLRVNTTSTRPRLNENSNSFNSKSRKQSQNSICSTLKCGSVDSKFQPPNPQTVSPSIPARFKVSSPRQTWNKSSGNLMNYRENWNVRRIRLAH